MAERERLPSSEGARSPQLSDLVDYFPKEASAETHSLPYVGRLGPPVIPAPLAPGPGCSPATALLLASVCSTVSSLAL